MKTISLPAQLTRTRRFTLGVPDRFTVSSDGSVVYFCRSRAGDDPVAGLWALEVGTAAERLVADPRELLASAPLGNGVGDYAIDGSGGLVAFVLGGGLWTRTGDDVRRLPVDGPVTDPRPDPAGRRIAYVAGGALRLIEADGSGDRVVAAPDGPEVTFGTGVHTGATSVDGARGHWWSPDGERLLVLRVDATAVERWHLADPADPTAPPWVIRYAAAGTANADVTALIVDLDGARVEAPWAQWARSEFEYVVGAGWDGHGPYVIAQSRDQRTVRTLAIDPRTGATTVVSEQRDDRWVQLVHGLPARTASGALVAHADRDGTRHLTVDSVAVTPANLQLRAVLGVDGDDVLFTASDEPTERQLWVYGPGAGASRLSTEPGLHSGVRRGGTLVHIAAGADRPGGQVTVTRAGTAPAAVASFVESPVLGVHARRLTLGADELRAALYLPSWHRPDHGSLPVVVDSYGGAALQRVTLELDWRVLVSQWFAEQGFAVLVVDGRGTPGRGPAWERAVHGDLFGPVLDDQVTALHEATRQRPELDLDRVGIRGWSFGGSLAALAVLRRPDVFHAAVAGAGVTDQRLYNTHWRERFLGHPDEFPQRYAAASLLAAAPTLTRPLLLMHGLLDDNVYPVNTLRLSGALLAAGRPHELVLLPGVGHQAMGVPVTESLLWRQVRFLQKHLGVDAE